MNIFLLGIILSPQMNGVLTFYSIYYSRFLYYIFWHSELRYFKQTRLDCRVLAFICNHLYYSILRPNTHGSHMNELYVKDQQYVRRSKALCLLQLKMLWPHEGQASVNELNVRRSMPSSAMNESQIFFKIYFSHKCVFEQKMLLCCKQ